MLTNHKPQICLINIKIKRICNLLVYNMRTCQSLSSYILCSYRFYLTKHGKTAIVVYNFTYISLDVLNVHVLFRYKKRLIFKISTNVRIEEAKTVVTIFFILLFYLFLNPLIHLQHPSVITIENVQNIPNVTRNVNDTSSRYKQSIDTLKCNLIHVNLYIHSTSDTTHICIHDINYKSTRM